jgi:hypothetical protein
LNEREPTWFSDSVNLPFILVVRSDPKPNEIGTGFDGQGAVVKADADRPISADFFELQRRMTGIAL